MAKDLNRSIKIYMDHSDVMKKTTDVEKKMTSLRQTLADLDAQGKKGTAEYAKAEKALNQLAQTYGRYQEQLKNTERILRNLSGATEDELKAVRNQLNRELKKTTRGTDEYRTKLQALAAVEKELAIVEKERLSSMGKNATFRSRMADGFNKYFGVVTSVIAGITGLSFTFRKLAENVAKMDDVYSDVIKTTGLTRDEVVDLNEEFKKMDTRTAREELNLLARDAGKLGLNSKKDLLDFAEAGNQIRVSLGEDLGDDAIKNIGKMTDVFALSTKELERMDLKGKMLAIGSAINELGQSSTAAESYMVNFAQRLGGVASQAGISIQNILGYASALDQSGQAVEMSATAVQKFIMSLMGNPAKFAKIAGIEVSKFNNLLKTDTNEAIKLVLTSLSSKGGFQALIPIFKDMGLDGARAVGVLSALATNIDKVNEAQKISNKAFSDGVSITNEYDVKNNNMQAILEKQRKLFNDAALELGERLNPVLLKSTKLTTYFIKALPSLIDWFEKYGKYILYVAAAWLSYIAGTKLSIFYEKARNAVMTISRLITLSNAVATATATGNTIRATAAQQLYNTEISKGSIISRAYVAVTRLFSAAKFLLTGNITKAREAMLAFNTTMKLNVFGAVLVVVTALAAALYKVWQNKIKLINVSEKLKEVEGRYNQELAKEQGEVKELFDAYKQTNPASEEHKRIREIIISKYGQYLKGLLDEKGELTDIGEALRVINERLREQIALKIRDTAVEEIRTKAVETYTGVVDNIMDKVSEQIKSKDVQNEIRKSLNTMLTDIQEGTNYEVDQMSGRISNKLRDFGVDVYKGGGFFGTNVDDYISRLLNNVKNFNQTIDGIKSKYDGMFDEMLEINNLIDNNDTTTKTPDGYLPTDKKAVKKQKTELALALEAIETAHQKKLLEIKQKYRSGDIESEYDFKNQTFAQEQAYYLVREQALTEFLKKVTDKELRSDINKQIAEIQNRRLDQELKYKAALEKIILDANPVAKEEKEYEDRLRAHGLFGLEREQMTEQQLEAFELLEKQHSDNMVRIRKDLAAKTKAAANESFEEDFKARKEQLEKELADEKQQISLRVGIGALSDAEAFEAERALQQKRIALIQEEIAARQKAGLDVTKLMQKQRTEELALTNMYVQEYNRRTADAKKYGQDIGAVVGSVITGQEDAMQAFSNIMIDILFDLLSQMINAEIARLTIVGTATVAETTAKEIASKGIFGLGTAAMLTGIITATMAVAKTALKGMLGKKKGSSTSSSGFDTGKSSGSGERVYNQRAFGKYDVIGADDGKLYQNVPFTGVATTGVVATPTLMGEQGSELVVSHPDFVALQKHMNYPLIVQAIKDVQNGRVPQRASGKYDVVDSQSNTDNSSLLPGMDRSIILELISTMKSLRDKDFDINYQRFEKAKKIMDTARAGASKR